MGPKGMDKMLQSPDGEITITNDGATIVEKMDVKIIKQFIIIDYSSYCKTTS